MMSRQGGLVALLLGTWSAAVRPRDRRRTRPRRAMRPSSLPNSPQSSPWWAGSIRQDASNRDASDYSQKFAHRKMADGRPMNPQSNAAASKTLPLGTTAKVTNLQNARSATVKIQDRGPHVAGRVIDASPVVAEQLDLRKQGAARVEGKADHCAATEWCNKAGRGRGRDDAERDYASCRDDKATHSHRWAVTTVGPRRAAAPDRSATPVWAELGLDGQLGGSGRPPARNAAGCAHGPASLDGPTFGVPGIGIIFNR